MEIFLHDYVATPGERGIFLADDRRIDHRLVARIFGAVDEAQEVAVVEVTKALNLIDRRDRAVKARHDLRRHLEAKIHSLGTDVEEQVPWRGNRMPKPGPDFPERVKFGWPRISEQPVPCIGPDPHHTGKTGFELAKSHRANQRREVRAERSNGRALIGVRIYRQNQEDRGASEWCRYGLRNSHSVNLREVFRIGLWHA